MTVDGGAGKGATRLEPAHLLHDLGAVDALNMDGGGSATLVWQNAFANTPSDERNVPSPTRSSLVRADTPFSEPARPAASAPPDEGAVA
ncbi:phosphodiester glycosidase family protein [Streptomyces sp. NPDC006207]